MKKSFIYLVIIFSVTLIYGCKKNKPKSGEYLAEFHYTIPEHLGIIKESYLIQGIDENYMTVSLLSGYPTTVLEKSNKNVTGKLPAGGGVHFRQIEGTWEKKKGRYIIKGTFTQMGYNPVGPAETLSGTFELKSNH